MESFLAALTLAIVGYIFGSIRIIQQGNEGIVERFGQYRRTLRPGLNFVIPAVDTVYVETTREQLLDIAKQKAITQDNVTINVDAILYWKILDVQKAYYAVEDLEAALANLVVTTLRSEIGRMDLRQTFSNRNKINQELLNELDKATENWGVKVMRVEIQEIELSPDLERALERERVAESERKAQISEADATVESINRISRALQSHPNAAAVLRYLATQHYVQANVELGKSPSSKIIFMDPRTLSQNVSELISETQIEQAIENLGEDGQQ
jgi:regulator of protease activity HflC (stomatin/prohibitin superfamily)